MPRSASPAVSNASNPTRASRSRLSVTPTNGPPSSSKSSKKRAAESSGDDEDGDDDDVRLPSSLYLLRRDVLRPHLCLLTNAISPRLSRSAAQENEEEDDEEDDEDDEDDDDDDDEEDEDDDEEEEEEDEDEDDDDDDDGDVRLTALHLACIPPAVV